MAARLLDAGHDLTVWNRTSAKTEPLVEQGATAAASPGAAVAGADAVITMLADPQALSRMLFADDGVVGALSPGQWLHRHVHLGPDTIRSVEHRMPEQVTLVDAPVPGSVPERPRPAIIFVGATQSAFENVEPLLAPLGTPHHVGGPGAGAAAKLVANLTLGMAITALGRPSRSVARSVSTAPPCWTSWPRRRSEPPPRASARTSRPAPIRPASSCATHSRTYAWSPRPRMARSSSSPRQHATG